MEFQELELTIPREGTDSQSFIFYTAVNSQDLPGAKSWEFIVQAGFMLAVTRGLAFKLKKIYNI